VAEWAVIGKPDPEKDHHSDGLRGANLRYKPSEKLVKDIQDYVKWGSWRYLSRADDER
jgi:hypothetical protein